jgi:CheY-like chemotaxis protein
MTNQPIFLYVEDDPMSRLVMQIIIERGLGYEYLTIFEDSHHFMERVVTLPHKPDVVFLDIHVQPHSGFQMLDMLRQHPDYADAIVVALTASVMNEEIELLKEAGFNSVLAKPLDQARFPELLDQILAGEAIWYIN